MQNSLRKNAANVTLKSSIFSIILVVTTLSWYLFFFSSIKNSGFEGIYPVLIFGINLISTVLFAVLGSKIFKKIGKRLKFITYWIIVGVLLSFLTLFLGGCSFFYVTLISSVIGGYFGFGFPIVLGYYTVAVKNVYRGQISGLTVFFTFAIFVAVSILAYDAIIIAVTLILLKFCGLLAIWLLKPSDEGVNSVVGEKVSCKEENPLPPSDVCVVNSVVEEKVSYKEVLTDRSVLLYFVPWLLFSLVNNFAFPVLYNAFGVNIVNAMTQFEVVLVGLSAIFFGFLADRFGRKHLLFIGFVLIGLGYAFLSFFHVYEQSFLVYTFIDGISWGIFFPLFLLTLWGDIADKRGAEKFFVIGFLPYLLSDFLQLLFGNYVANTITDLSAVFSFTCFFLFVAAIPLFLASETMPEQDKHIHDLRKFYEKAQKKVDREIEKSKKANRDAAVANNNDDAATGV